MPKTILKRFFADRRVKTAGKSAKTKWFSIQPSSRIPFESLRPGKIGKELLNLIQVYDYANKVSTLTPVRLAQLKKCRPQDVEVVTRVGG